MIFASLMTWTNIRLNGDLCQQQQLNITYKERTKYYIGEAIERLNVIGQTIFIIMFPYFLNVCDMFLQRDMCDKNSDWYFTLGD